MRGVDVIAFQVENKIQLHSILNAALRNAIIETPFCHNSNSVSETIHSNFERNVALGLFREYAAEALIPLSWKSGSAFYNVNFDFDWGENSFLLMNKMVRKAEAFDSNEYVFLPALIPNRFDNDRWATKQSDSSGKTPSFVFTFLDTGNSIDLANTYYNAISPELEAWLSVLKRRYKNSSVNNSPFTEEWFLNEVSRRGGLPLLKPGFKPSLIITGVCMPEHYGFFSDTDGFSEFAYALYTGRWYEVKSPGVLSFRKGIVLSKFKNATCPMAALPSFSELMNG